ncbi:MAG: SAM-dependent methyltransferase [Bacillota bacterium]|nr:SAM-dependent methyltransferase [Bacillota bacterium]
MTKIYGLMLSCDPRFRQSLYEEVRTRQGNIQVTTVSPGVIKVDRLEGSDSLLSDLLENTPLFLRHLFAIHKTAPADSALDVATAASTIIPTALEGHKVGVQCRILSDSISYRAVEVKQHLDEVIRSRGGVPETKDPQFVISIVITDKAYMGYSTPSSNLTRWSGGAVHYGAAKNSFSRAQHKLEEALEVLDIDISKCKTALDLGAAPGGWTALLLARGLHVTAVDTGDLHPDLLKHQNLKYLRQNAFDLRLLRNSLDMITCDMSWDPLRTARLLIDLSKALRIGGKLVLTVKFMGHSPLLTVRECLSILRTGFIFKRGRHLWHNREEITLYLEKL